MINIMAKFLMRQNKFSDNRVYSFIASKRALVSASLLVLTSCSVIEPIPRAYPPARHVPVHPPRQIPPRAQPPKPAVNHSGVTRPRPVIKVPAVEPEQGANPYDEVPQRRPTSSRAPVVSGNVSSSPAVKSLIRQAKLDMAVKRNAAAISKLERALRIESRNPAIWHQLAKANYNDGKDATAISMAKKSNIYTAENSPLEKLNWQLIKLASKRSGNIRSLKAAIRYDQTHP